MYIYFIFMFSYFPFINYNFCIFSLFKSLSSNNEHITKANIEYFTGISCTQTYSSFWIKKYSNPHFVVLETWCKHETWCFENPQRRKNWMIILQNILFVQSRTELHFHTFRVPWRTWLQFSAEALISNMEVAEHSKKLRCLSKSIFSYNFFHDFDSEIVYEKSVFLYFVKKTLGQSAGIELRKFLLTGFLCVIKLHQKWILIAHVRRCCRRLQNG